MKEDKNLLDFFRENKNAWALLSERRQISTLRKIFGMEPISEKSVTCKKCPALFIAQFKGGRQQQWYCRHCLWNMDKMANQI